MPNTFWPNSSWPNTNAVDGALYILSALVILELFISALSNEQDATTQLVSVTQDSTAAGVTDTQDATAQNVTMVV